MKMPVRKYLKNLRMLCFVLILPAAGFAQNDPHYTMFMFNKLLYNPAYAGSRDVTSVDAVYRDQWVGISGAPKTFNLSVDGPVGSYMKPFRSVAVGLSLNNEQIGVESNTNIMAYYAYRIKFKSSVLSFGLQGGAKLYTANYSQLNPYQQNDLNLTHDIKNAFLPNFGAGVYWSGDKFYVGGAVPNMLQNYYDKSMSAANNQNSREIRGYYLNGGYVFPINETIKIEPQVLIRYAGNGTYHLPVNSDLNVSAIIYDRLLFGITYRTDKSFEGIVHMQVTNSINIGYAYDYSISVLNGYSGGTHEIVAGFNFIRDNSKYSNPRFAKLF